MAHNTIVVLMCAGHKANIYNKYHSEAVNESITVLNITANACIDWKPHEFKIEVLWLLDNVC